MSLEENSGECPSCGRRFSDSSKGFCAFCRSNRGLRRRRQSDWARFVAEKFANLERLRDAAVYLILCGILYPLLSADLTPSEAVPAMLLLAGLATLFVSQLLSKD